MIYTTRDEPSSHPEPRKKHVPGVDRSGDKLLRLKHPSGYIVRCELRKPLYEKQRTGAYKEVSRVWKYSDLGLSAEANGLILLPHPGAALCESRYCAIHGATALGSREVVKLKEGKMALVDIPSGSPLSSNSRNSSGNFRRCSKPNLKSRPLDPKRVMARIYGSSVFCLAKQGRGAGAGPRENQDQGSTAIYEVCT